MSDPTRDQWEMDLAESLYDEQCWREDRDELLGLTVSRPSLAEFIADEGRRRAAWMQFDSQVSDGPAIPRKREAS